MSVEVSPPGGNVRDADEAQALASAIIARTGGDEEFDAGRILKNHPGLTHYHSVVVDLAYEEFCRRLDAGDPPDPREFAQRFPAVADSLLELLEVHKYFEDHPDAFAPGAPPAWPQARDEISGFALVHEIGRGGFSRVFLAQEKAVGDREVVVKICVQANEEAARLGRLDHPHIVPILSVQPHSLSGFTLICMPYLGSATLADVIGEVFAAGMTRRRGADLLKAIDHASQRHGVPKHGQSSNPDPIHWTRRSGSYAEAILETGAELCEALDYAHRQGICHCDVKPSNVLLTAGGRSLLLDFNLSMQRDGAAAIVGGTLPYMAPEQLRFVLADDPKSLPAIDHRADVFALGVTMFQLLTGKLPFPVEEHAEDKKETARRLLDKQLKGKDLRRELAQVVSPATAGVITECLAFHSDDRPQSASQVARQFRHDLRAMPRVQRWVRSHKATATGAVAALVLAVALLAYGLVRYFSVADLVRGWEDMKHSEFESARDHFDASWKQTGSAESAASLAYCLTQMWYYREGEFNFAKAVEMGLKTAAIQNNRGYCLLRLGKYVEATALLEDALRLDPKQQAARHNLAIVKCNQAQKLIVDAADARTKGLIETSAKHERLAGDFLRSALDCIDDAMNCGEKSAELERNAAHIHVLALACVSDLPAEAQNHAIRERAWEYLELHPPPLKIVEEVMSLNLKLRHDPRFQQMKTANPAPTAEISTTQLVDIYPDICSRLTAFSR